MLWQIYKYTQAVQEQANPSANPTVNQATQTEQGDDGLQEVEAELYEKPATLKLDN